MKRCVHTRLGAISARNPPVSTRMTRLTIDHNCMSRLDSSWICLCMSSARANLDGCSCLTCDIPLPLAKNTPCPKGVCNRLVDSGQKVRRNPLCAGYLSKEQKQKI